MFGMKEASERKGAFERNEAFGKKRTKCQEWKKEKQDVFSLAVIKMAEAVECFASLAHCAEEPFLPA